MGVYLRAKFEVSSIILTGFRQGGGGNFTPPPPQNEPLKSQKSPPRLGLKVSEDIFDRKPPSIFAVIVNRLCKVFFK